MIIINALHYRSGKIEAYYVTLIKTSVPNKRPDGETLRQQVYTTLLEPAFAELLLGRIPLPSSYTALYYIQLARLCRRKTLWSPSSISIEMEKSESYSPTRPASPR